MRVPSIATQITANGASNNAHGPNGTKMQVEKYNSSRKDESNKEEDEEEDEDRLHLKFLNFKDEQEYYNHMCKLQMKEFTKKMSKATVDKFVKKNNIQSTFEASDNKPKNYAKMCKLQNEEVEGHPQYKKLIAGELKKKEKAAAAKAIRYCATCGAPRKGHICQLKLEDKKEDGEEGSGRRSRRKRTRINYTENADEESERLGEIMMDEPKKRVKKKKEDSDDETEPDDPSRVLFMQNQIVARTKQWNNLRARIVVIGAGISGIAAARYLHTIGYHNITILEGRERIGGRIHTITSEELKHGYGLDIGAAFIHGTDGNPIYHLTSATGVKLFSAGNDCLMYDHDGKRIDPLVDKTIERMFNVFLDASDRVRHKERHNLSRRFVDKRPPPKPQTPTPTAPTASTSTTSSASSSSSSSTSTPSSASAIASMISSTFPTSTQSTTTTSVPNTTTSTPSTSTTTSATTPSTSSSDVLNSTSTSNGVTSSETTTTSTDTSTTPMDTSSTDLTKDNEKPEAKKAEEQTQSDNTNKEQKQADVSLGSTLNAIMLAWQQKNRSFSNDEWRILNWHFANIEGPCGADISLLSLNHWDQDDPYEFQGDHCLLQQGYGWIVNELSHGLNIKLGHKVDSVDYTNDEIKVRTSKGTFFADAVICTLPLGVLKTGNVSFTPSLPEDKLSSIKRLGFGLLNKLVLFFPKVFWDKDTDNIGYTSETRGEFYLFINMTKIVNSPVLVANIAGQAAYSLETLSGEEVVTRAMTILQKLYGASIPKPIRAVVTRWNCDPFALGSYSYLAVGSSGDDYDCLSKPLSNKLFFAGEHTNRHHPSTVSGAYMSGFRAAVEAATAISARTLTSTPTPNMIANTLPSSLPSQSTPSTTSTQARPINTPINTTLPLNNTALMQNLNLAALLKMKQTSMTSPIKQQPTNQATMTPKPPIQQPPSQPLPMNVPVPVPVPLPILSSQNHVIDIGSDSEEQIDEVLVGGVIEGSSQLNQPPSVLSTTTNSLPRQPTSQPSTSTTLSVQPTNMSPTNMSPTNMNISTNRIVMPFVPQPTYSSAASLMHSWSALTTHHNSTQPSNNLQQSNNLQSNNLHSNNLNDIVQKHNS